jgi:hypothetical protein
MTPFELLLVTCVYEKADSPRAAKDLYCSPYFQRLRRYAERHAKPWFIVSAEHGLVRPDEWLAPYERYLPDTPSWYQEVWGSWVAARLRPGTTSKNATTRKREPCLTVTSPPQQPHPREGWRRWRQILRDPAPNLTRYSETDARSRETGPREEDPAPTADDHLWRRLPGQRSRLVT